MAKTDDPVGRHILFAPTYYHPQLHKGIARFAAEHGWHLNSKMTVDSRVIHGWRGDGAILQPPTTKEYQAFAEGLKVPMVCMGDFDWECPRIMDDDVAIGREASKHFLARGFRSFAVYSDLPRESPPELESFKHHLVEGGHTCAELRTLPGTWDWQRQGRFIADRLRELPKPLAVFARRDHAGIDVIDACLEHGLKVPTEVAVLGKHNNELICNALSVPLSSVDNNLELMGYMAAELLERVLKGESVPSKTLVPVKGVVTRASTDILAIDHPRVRAALHVIHDSFKRPIGLEDIARKVGISVRGLQHAFRRAVGHTVNEEIIRLRMQLAKDLLETTDLTVETIALDAGFHSMRNFHRLFKKATDLTPKQYRLGNR